jgi:hypothetical protein
MKQFAKMFFLVALVLLVTGMLAMAQETGRIYGTVTDQSGAAIAGANVTVTETSTNRVLNVTSGATGNYLVSALPIGSYKVDVKNENFKAETASLKLDIGEVREVNFKLQVGQTAESINVTDEVPLVETATSEAGEIIQGRQTVELPLNGRNFTSLALLTPGVSRGAYDANATNSSETWRNAESGGAFLVVNGMRKQANNYQIDGVDNNESLVNTLVIYPAVEDIAEFKMTTNTAPAEFGRAGGAMVQVATKSGSNDIHGAVYWFNRSKEGAAQPFNDTSKMHLSRNQFGVSLGGPILKNHIFGFVDYQGWRQSTPQSDGPTHVPTDAMRNGDFSGLLGPGATATSVPIAQICPNLYPGGTGTTPLPQFAASNGYVYNPQTCFPFGWDTTTNQPGVAGVINVIPGARQNAVAMRFLNAFPEPNIAGANAATNGSNFQPNRQKITNRDDYDARLDFSLTPKESVFVRYSLGDDLLHVTDRLVDSTHDLPSGWGSGMNPQHPRQVAVGYTRVITDKLINEFHYSWSRPVYGYEQPGYGKAMAANLGIPNANTSSLLGGMALIGGWAGNLEYVGDGGPYVVQQPSHQFTDAVTWTQGRNTWKFGFSVIHRDVDFTQANNAKGYFMIDDNNCNCNGNYGSFPIPYSGHGTFTGHEISELAGGFVGGYTIGVFNGYYRTRSWENSFYGQDDLRVNRKLTLNLGLRYDIFTWPTEANNRQSNFDPSTGTLVEPGTAGWPSALINTPKGNVGPRMGFAYDLMGDGKTVVRGGYGLFFYLDRGGVGVQLSQNPEFNGSESFYACPDTTTAGCANGGRYTLSGAAANGSTDVTSATGELPVAANSVDPKHLNSNDNVYYQPKDSHNSNIQQWNLQVEHVLYGQTTVDMRYVGAHMDKMATSFNANGGALGTGTQWFSNVGSINEYGMIGKGDYNGFQARLNRNMTKGLQYTLSYTWSHTTDNSVSAQGGAGGVLVGANGTPLLHYMHGNSDNDQRHLFTASWMYELPFGRGKQFGGSMPKALDYVVGGWQWSNVVVWATGTPFDLSGSNGPNGRPDYHGGCSTNAHWNVWIECKATSFGENGNPKAISGLVGTLGRNYFHGPGTQTWDTTLSKSFSMTERVKSEFRVQVYNLLNHPLFQNPDNNYNDAPNTSNLTGFGVLNTPRTDSNRELEVAMRISF